MFNQNEFNQNGTNQSPRTDKKKSRSSFYWQSFGLTQDPFPLIPDESAYFPVPAWENHLDLLQHLIQTENVLLAIIGNSGYGKSTFLRHMHQTLADEYYIHSVMADHLFDSAKLITELGSGFNLQSSATTTKETLELQLEAQINEIQHKDKTCLLLIDNAQLLPLECINSMLLLIKQQSTTQMRLHIILFGDSNLQIKLSNLAKNETAAKTIHAIELEPLTLEETKQYLYYYLTKAGAAASFPLSQISIEKIYANSHGIPENINRVAQQVLLEELMKERNKMTSSVFKRHQTKIIGACLLILILFALSYFLNRKAQLEPPASKLPVISFANQNELITPAPTTAPSTNVSAESPLKSSSVPKLEINSSTTTHLSNVETNATESHESSMPSVEKVLSATASAATPAATTSTQSLMPVTPTPATTAFPSTMPTNNTAVNTRANKKTIPHKKTYATHIHHLPKTVSTLRHTVNNKGLKRHQQGKCLLNQHRYFYTLQIIGLSHESAMITFITANHLQHDAHYVLTSLHGKPWYILLYGMYKTQQDAVNAIAHLPLVLQKYHPWPRSLTQIKKDMK